MQSIFMTVDFTKEDTRSAKLYDLISRYKLLYDQMEESTIKHLDEEHLKDFNLINGLYEYAKFDTFDKRISTQILEETIEDSMVNIIEANKCDGEAYQTDTIKNDDFLHFNNITSHQLGININFNLNENGNFELTKIHGKMK